MFKVVEMVILYAGLWMVDGVVMDGKVGGGGWWLGG